MTWLLFGLLASSVGADIIPIGPGDVFETGTLQEKSTVDDRPWEPFRIETFYNMDDFNRLTAAQKTVATIVIRMALDFFQNAIRVRRDVAGILAQLTCNKKAKKCERRLCGETDDPLPDDVTFFKCPNEKIEKYTGFPKPCNTSKEMNQPVKADFLWRITFNQTDSGAIAYARPCSIDVNTRRPTTGMMNFEPDQLAKLADTVAEHGYDQMRSVVLHEMSHMFFFHPFLMEQFPGYSHLHINSTRFTVYPEIKESYIKDEPLIGIAFPKSLAAVKKYMGCDQIKYIELENGGGDGSIAGHFEADFLPYEYIRSYMGHDHLHFSEVSFALMEDSGWYKVNYSMADAAPPLPMEPNDCMGAKNCASQHFPLEKRLKCIAGRKKYYNMLNETRHLFKRCLSTPRVSSCDVAHSYIKNVRCLDHAEAPIFKNKTHTIAYHTAQCYKIKCDLETGKVKFVSNDKVHTCDKPGDVIKLSEKFIGKFMSRWDPFLIAHSLPLNHSYTIDHQVICPSPCEVCEHEFPKCATLPNPQTLKSSSFSRVAPFLIVVCFSVLSIL